MADSSRTELTADDLEALRFAAERNAAGLAFKELGNLDAARAKYDRALAAIEGSSGRLPHAEAALFHNLGGVEYARGCYSEAESFARHGLAIRRGDPSSLPSEIAADLNALAAILEALGRLVEAETLYSETLAALEQLPGDNAAEVSVSLNGLATLAAKHGDLDRATTLLERALELRRRSSGVGHPNLAVVLHNLRVVYRRRGIECLPETVDEIHESAGAIHGRFTPACHCPAVRVRLTRDAHRETGMTRSTDPNPREDATMEKPKTRIRIELTAEQKKQIKEASGEDVQAIELTAQELEDRIAPVSYLP